MCDNWTDDLLLFPDRNPVRSVRLTEYPIPFKPNLMTPYRPCVLGRRIVKAREVKYKVAGDRRENEDGVFGIRTVFADALGIEWDEPLREFERRVEIDETWRETKRETERERADMQGRIDSMAVEAAKWQEEYDAWKARDGFGKPDTGMLESLSL